MPYFEGLQDETIKQGSVFDLTEGVRAFDGDDQEITYTYSPTNDEFDTCAVGSYTIQYHASQTADKMLPNMCIPGGLALTTPRYCDDYESTTAKRIIKIIRASNPQILGIPHVTIAKNATLDVLNGVSAVDDNGNPIADISYSGTLDKQVSGDIVSISDGDNKYPVKSLKVTLEPIQSGSGDPSPDNVRPISGHTEVDTEVCVVNLFDKTTALDGYINDANGNFMPSSSRKATDYIRVQGGESYLIKTTQTESEWGAWYDENKNFIIKCVSYEGDTVKTAPSNAYYLRLTCVGASTGSLDTFAVNYPSTDTDYHAYQGDTYTTTLGRTVYGGTLDVVSGGLVVDRAMVDLGTLDWTLHAQGFMWSSGMRSAVKAPSSSSDLANIVCSSLESVTALSIYNGSNGIGIHSNGDVRVRYDNMPTDPTAFKTAVSGVQLCYELATPQTYQLDPQTISLLHGNNNVWSDGEMTMVYSLEIPTDGEVSYPLEGEYEITYSATDKCGNVGEAIRQITVE